MNSILLSIPLNKRLSNNREAGDVRRYRAHYNVTVMLCVSIAENSLNPIHRDLVTHISAALSPVRRQTITWTTVDVSSIDSTGWGLSEIKI